ncbi:hypothetical protein [Streptomyces koyangensis]|uniref:Uncharacterized protein n=1 Tax=Streptomyces koyangensis TaxID=188770 RepID=A0ABX7ECK1_9ACTN|nr:hypothetical protein [Streptomyces koyangensis]QRF02239.1 hypothetical protein G9U55_08485 [Streptomyces koyangensis]
MTLPQGFGTEGLNCVGSGAMGDGVVVRTADLLFQGVSDLALCDQYHGLTFADGGTTVHPTRTFPSESFDGREHSTPATVDP